MKLLLRFRSMILHGEKVMLKTSTEKDVPYYWKWICDKKVTRHITSADFPKTYRAELKWFRSMKRHKNERLFFITETATKKPIGNLGIHEISHRNRKAAIGIMIGEKAYWGKGFGTDALKTVLRYCFTQLKLNKVSLTVDIDHPHAIRCYKKCGFKKVGFLKDDTIKNGKKYDSYLMEAFANDFLKNS